MGRQITAKKDIEEPLESTAYSKLRPVAERFAKGPRRSGDRQLNRLIHAIPLVLLAFPVMYYMLLAYYYFRFAG